MGVVGGGGELALLGVPDVVTFADSRDGAVVFIISFMLSV